MSLVFNLVMGLNILSALAMIGLILVQHGKGADMGAAFGSGASGSLFGASGSANFLSHATAALATVFLVTTLALAYFGFNVRTSADTSSSVLQRAAASAPAPTTSQATPPAGAAVTPVDNSVPSLNAASAPAAAASGAAQIPAQ